MKNARISSLSSSGMNEIAATLSPQQLNSISESSDSPINQHADHTESEKPFKCKYRRCDAAFSKASKLTIHFRQHTGERPYKCDYDGCDKSYTNTSHLKRHVQTHDLVKQSLKCPKCSQMISNRQNLRRHYERVHSENIQFYCEECDLKFVKETKYKEHQAIHQGVALYKCEICSKRFTTLNTFKKHKRTHDVKKEYKCTAQNCSEVFDKWSLLCKHKNSKHVSEYKCKDCDKVLLSKAQLKSHSSVHVDNRSILPCPYEKCPRFYFFKRNLDHHVRTNHLGKKYHCDICDMRLSTKQKIVEHMNKIHLAKRKKKKKKKSVSNETEKRKRNDTGTEKKSMLSKLVGLDLPRSIEKEIINRKSRIQFGEEDTARDADSILEISKEMEVEDETSINGCNEVANNCTDDISPPKSDENQVINESPDQTDKQRLTNCNIKLLIAT